MTSNARNAHPRLSVSAMCTLPWSFAEDLALWSELGLRHAGLLLHKAEAYGTRAALRSLKERGITATTVITAGFDLTAPDTWPDTRAGLRRAVDFAAEAGGCPYFTPGAGDGRPVEELADTLARAVGPCAAYAADRGVRLAIEPTLRADKSFVHTLRGGVEVAERAGLDVIADLGNCRAEPELARTLLRAGPRIAAVQFADAVPGPPGRPPDGGDRAVPGDGALDIAGFLGSALAAGYDGPFELEQVGPRIAAEGHGPAARRAAAAATALIAGVLGAGVPGAGVFGAEVPGEGAPR
jgi:sugar phosphate isomerase/epimerase